MSAFQKQDVTSPARVTLNPDSYILQLNFVIMGGLVNFIPQAEFISLDAEAQSPTELTTSATEIHFLSLFLAKFILKQNLFLTEYS